MCVFSHASPVSTEMSSVNSSDSKRKELDGCDFLRANLYGDASYVLIVTASNETPGNVGLESYPP